MLGIFITAGYPSVDATIKALKILNDAEVDLIELGVPFSDPLADGPVIQKASHEALKQGMNLDRVFNLVNEVKTSTKIITPGKGLDNLILFSYYNPLYVYGFDKLIDQCLKSGVRGVLIPDLPVDEAAILSEKFKEANLDLILLAAITSNEERLQKIIDYAGSWIYLVSRIGITGSDKDISGHKVEDLAEIDLCSNVLKYLKKHTNKPIALGFGIDSGDKVASALNSGADIAIVGSKAIRVMEEDSTEDLSKFRKFITELKVSADSFVN